MDTSVDTITNLPARILACILHCSTLIVSIGCVTEIYQDRQEAFTFSSWSFDRQQVTVTSSVTR